MTAAALEVGVLTESPYSVGGVNAALPAMAGHDDRDTTATLDAARPEPIPAPPTAHPYRAETQAPDPENWRAQAVCAQVDPELFFPEKGGSSRAARAICREACPVRVQCLASALHRNEFGIWGGTTERQRRTMTAAQRRAHLAAADYPTDERWTA